MCKRETSNGGRVGGGGENGVNVGAVETSEYTRKLGEECICTGYRGDKLYTEDTTQELRNTWRR